MSDPSPSDRGERSASLVREYLEALLVAILFALFARTFLVQAFKIPSSSMEQNLLVGDHILVNKFIYRPTRFPIEARLLPLRPVRRGDVVVFQYPVDPSRDFIKRCVGLPGDTVEIVDKGLSINGEPVEDEPYVHHSDVNVYRSPLVHERYRQRDNFGPYTVPEHHYFCLGDNRDDSDDSRFWGPVPESHVKGRAFMIYWSVAAAGGGTADGDEAPAAAGSRLERLRRLARTLVFDTRWERTFRIVR